MANYFSSDITFLELQNAVLRELHEPVSTGSEAVPLDYVEDVLNMVYAEAFNNKNIKKSAREANVSFKVANDSVLNGAVLTGAVTMDLDDASTWQTAGRVLFIDDIATYTGKSTNQLTGVTGVNVDHADGASVRQMYNLSTLTTAAIEGENIQFLSINGIPQQYMAYEDLITQIHAAFNCFTVYEGYLLFGRNSTEGASTSSSALMVYTQKITPMSATTDTPSLIPNSFRAKILVNGACMKIAASDAYRTSWDYWKQQYEEGLKEYVVFKNTRVSDRNNKLRPTVYQSYNRF